MPEPIKTRVKPSEMRIDDDLTQDTPLASTPPRTLQMAPAEPQQVKEPLQGTFTKGIAKAIRREALEAEKTIGEFLTECFNAYMARK